MKVSTATTSSFSAMTLHMGQLQSISVPALWWFWWSIQYCIQSIQTGWNIETTTLPGHQLTVVVSHAVALLRIMNGPQRTAVFRKEFLSYRLFGYKRNIPVLCLTWSGSHYQRSYRKSNRKSWPEDITLAHTILLEIITGSLTGSKIGSQTRSRNQKVITGSHILKS